MFCNLKKTIPPSKVEIDLIELKNLRKNFSSGFSLGPVDLVLESRKTHVFVGTSGHGKTTIMKLIAGLIRPDEGEILIDGKNLFDYSYTELAKMVGYVVQTGGLFPHLTVEDNILLPAKLQKWSESKKQNRLNELCQLCDLKSQVLKSYPYQISGGQKQRVGLMRALVLDPLFLLMDEPLGALDSMMRKELQAQLKTIFNELGKTVIMITHDLNEGSYFGHTISLIKSGKIIQHGAMEELAKNPADPFVKEFLQASIPHEDILGFLS